MFHTSTAGLPVQTRAAERSARRSLYAVLISVSLAAYTSATDYLFASGNAAPRIDSSAVLESIKSPSALASVQPDLLAKTVLSRSKIRFIGIDGFVVDVPGVQTSTCIVDARFVYVLPGTTDSFDSPYDKFLQDKAARIAERYNQLVAQHAQRRGALKSMLICR